MPTSVQQMAVQSGWMTEKLLKHIVQNYSGTEFTLTDLREDKVVSTQLTVAVKKSAPEKPAPKKKPPTKKAVKKYAPSDGFSPLAFLKENPDAPIEFSGSKGGKHGDSGRFGQYKAATNFSEFRELGGQNSDINYDFKRGLLEIPRDSIPQTPGHTEPEPSKKAKSEAQDELDEDTSDASIPSPLPQETLSPTSPEAADDDSAQVEPDADDSANEKPAADYSSNEGPVSDTDEESSEENDVDSDEDNDDTSKGFSGFAITPESSDSDDSDSED